MLLVRNGQVVHGMSTRVRITSAIAQEDLCFFTIFTKHITGAKLIGLCGRRYCHSHFGTHLRRPPSVQARGPLGQNPVLLGAAPVLLRFRVHFAEELGAAERSGGA